MGKFLSAFKFEVILFLVGVASLLLVIALRSAHELGPESELEIVLGIIVAIVPVALARLESMLREDREEVQKRFESATGSLSSQIHHMLDYCQDLADHNQLTMQRREFAASSAFVSVLERVPQYSADCSALVEQIASYLRDVSDGRYPIAKADAIYSHDTKRIQLLDKSDFYWATWSASANPKSLVDFSPESVAFTAYISAQKDAAQRGVQVVRLYILPDVSNLPEKLRIHLQELKNAGIKILLVSSKHLSGVDLCEDFVIIGKRVVGIGDPPRGPMERSIYYFNMNNGQRPEYRRYVEFFRDLQTASTEYV